MWHSKSIQSRAAHWHKLLREPGGSGTYPCRLEKQHVSLPGQYWFASFQCSYLGKDNIIVIFGSHHFSVEQLLCFGCAMKNTLDCSEKALSAPVVHQVCGCVQGQAGWVRGLASPNESPGNLIRNFPVTGSNIFSWHSWVLLTWLCSSQKVGGSCWVLPAIFVCSGSS